MLASLLASPVAAGDFQLSVYGSLFDVGESRVSGDDPAGAGSFAFDTGWTTKKLDGMPSFGIRGTWWADQSTGVALDFSHLKTRADDQGLTSSGFSMLEFDDGINTVTVNAMRRFPMDSRITPYVGGGIGLAVPGVDIQTSGSGPVTNEINYGGVVAQIQTGVEYQINENWSLFGEYQMNVIDLDIDLSGGGNLSTGLVTNSVNIGAGFSF